MKKLYDRDVVLTLHISNLNKNVQIVCSIHTIIHQLKIELCKKLNLPVFDTEMDIYGGSWKPLKPTSSLQQNGIQGNQANLSVHLRRMKVNDKLNVQVEGQSDKKKPTKEEQAGTGLLLKAACSNPHCVNYLQDIEVDIGYGTFPFYSVISDLKCSVCPYKSQHLQPKMMCKGVSVSQCQYSLKGTETDRGGIPSDRKMGYIRVKERKDIANKVMGKGWDRSNLILIVKHL